MKIFLIFNSRHRSYSIPNEFYFQFQIETKIAFMFYLFFDFYIQLVLFIHCDSARFRRWKRIERKKSNDKNNHTINKSNNMSTCLVFFYFGFFILYFGKLFNNEKWKIYEARTYSHSKQVNKLMMIICFLFFHRIEALTHCVCDTVCAFISIVFNELFILKFYKFDFVISLFFRHDMNRMKREESKWDEKQKPKLLVLRLKQQHKKRKVKQYKLEWERIVCVSRCVFVCLIARLFISSLFFLVFVRVDKIYVSTLCAVCVSLFRKMEFSK